MGKYDKFFPNLSDSQKKKLVEKIKAEYDKSFAQRARDIEWNNGPLKETEELLNWQRNGVVSSLDAYMVGPFTIREMAEWLGADMSAMNVREHFIKAMDNCMSVSKIEINKDKYGGFVVEYSDQVKSDMNALAEKNEKYTLTRWDKFWGFFGIKTDHARAVATSIAAVEAYKEKYQELSKTVMVKQLRQPITDMIERNKDACNHMKERISVAKAKVTGWNEIFFGEHKPNDYILNNGKKVSPLSLCLAAMNQRGEYDFSVMGPEQFAKMLENNDQLKAQVKQLGEKVSHMVANKEIALDVAKKLKHSQIIDVKDATKAYDNEIKAMLKPQNPRFFGLTRSAEFIMLGEKPDNSKRNMFGNACVMIKAMDDMAKIFGKKDEVYCSKNEMDKTVEKHIKDTFAAVQIYDAIEKEDYDTALKASTAGKNDFNNFDKVLKQCEKNITYLEADFTKQSVKPLVIEEKQLDDDFVM